MKRLALALSVAAALFPGLASAQLLINSSFESSTAGPGSAALYDTIVDSWFMENQSAASTAEVAQRRNVANMPVVPDGNQWLNLSATTSPSVPTAGVYQMLSNATYAQNQSYSLTLAVSQRSNFAFVGVEFSLWSGNVTGANSTTLLALGATQHSSFTINQTVFSAAGVAETYNVPSFNLTTGTNGTAGQLLWLRVSSTGIGQHLVDNITMVPEPNAAAMLLGAAGLAVLRRRRRLL